MANKFTLRVINIKILAITDASPYPPLVMSLNITMDAITFLGETRNTMAPTVVIAAENVFIKLVKNTGFSMGKMIVLIVFKWEAPRSLAESSILLSIVVKAALLALFATDMCLKVVFKMTMAVVPRKKERLILKGNYIA